jgi:hypothetical protein
MIPPWTNEDKVLEYVGDALELMWAEEEREHANLYNGQYIIPGVPIQRPTFTEREGWALEAATDNDFGPLAELLLNSQTR